MDKYPTGWMIGWWLEWKTCCMWTWEFKTSKTHGHDLLLLEATSGSVCMIAQCLNGLMTGWWLRTHGLHPHTHTHTCGALDLTQFQTLVEFNYCKWNPLSILCGCCVCLCVCVWWLTTPLAYWFTQHRECVATTNSGMWPKSLNRRAQWGCPVDRDPNAKSKILGFIIKPIKEPASSHLATTFWNV